MPPYIQHLTTNLVIPEAINQTEIIPVKVVGKPERMITSHQCNQMCNQSLVLSAQIIWTGEVRPL